MEQYIKQKENHLPIVPFYGDVSEDVELRGLIEFFDEQLKVKEVKIDMRVIAGIFKEKHCNKGFNN